MQEQWELDQTQVLLDQNLGLEQQRVQENLRVQAPKLAVHQTSQAAGRSRSHQQHIQLSVNATLDTPNEFDPVTKSQFELVKCLGTQTKLTRCNFSTSFGLWARQVCIQLRIYMLFTIQT